jgi:uncharacterized protein DUF2330
VTDRPGASGLHVGVALTDPSHGTNRTTPWWCVASNRAVDTRVGMTGNLVVIGRTRRRVLGAAFALAAAAWIAPVGSAPACGCGMALRARVPTEQALVSYHNGTETIVPGLNLTDVGLRSAVLFPVPRLPHVRALSGVDDLFSELESATSPRRTITPGSGPPTAGASRPNAVVREVVGGYEVSVLAATSASGLASWLRRYGYVLPRGAAPIMRGYVRRHWRFVAIRLAQRHSGELRPLSISFHASRIVYPMHLSAVASEPVSLELFVDADTPVYAAGFPSLGSTFAGPVTSLAPSLSLQCSPCSSART